MQAHKTAFASPWNEPAHPSHTAMAPRPEKKCRFFHSLVYIGPLRIALYNRKTRFGLACGWSEDAESWREASSLSYFFAVSCRSICT